MLIKKEKKNKHYERSKVNMIYPINHNELAMLHYLYPTQVITHIISLLFSPPPFSEKILAVLLSMINLVLIYFYANCWFNTSLSTNKDYLFIRKSFILLSYGNLVSLFLKVMFNYFGLRH